MVSYTIDPDTQPGKKFLDQGLQTAAGVPLQCDEGPDFKTFRVGVFGLKKWHQVDRRVGQLADALDRISLVVHPEVSKGIAPGIPLHTRSQACRQIRAGGSKRHRAELIEEEIFT